MRREFILGGLSLLAIVGLLFLLWFATGLVDVRDAARHLALPGMIIAPDGHSLNWSLEE